MFAKTKEVPLANTSLKNPCLYSEIRAKPEENLKHNGREVAGMGHEVGFQRALADWIIQHRSQWRKSGEFESRPDTI